MENKIPRGAVISMELDPIGRPGEFTAIGELEPFNIPIPVAGKWGPIHFTEKRRYYCAKCGERSDRGFIQLCRACSIPTPSSTTAPPDPDD